MTTTTCKESPTGKHEGDWESVTVDHDGNGTYIDIQCKHCGDSGCIGTQATLESGIDW